MVALAQFEGDDITLEDDARTYRDVADSLLREIGAGVAREALEDAGHTEIPEPLEPETDTLEEQAEAAVQSGRLLVTREITPPAPTRPKQSQQPKKPNKQKKTQGPNYRKKPPARTPRLQRARDSRPGWPYL